MTKISKKSSNKKHKANPPVLNVPTETFDDLINHMRFESYNDLNALEQLIHDAELSSKTRGYKMPSDHHIARYLLSNKMDAGWREISHEKLAPFQTMSTWHIPGEKEQKEQDEEAAKSFALFEPTIYDPGKVRHWNHADWDQFLLEMNHGPNYFKKAGKTYFSKLSLKSLYCYWKVLIKKEKHSFKMH
ncbi:hypothetical protein [Arachidicoccus terrestris]|uniref:hypothetical protein n=1 Tax=Arachidicoccus terrestris TaxID=2875539 RepID=UPI001CC36220|nr:hypothetical protein [Arachidicoccus terrestris]UAY55526.1 hypothetical protein K9M52_00365 [Arachidicoccus terrestris]